VSGGCHSGGCHECIRHCRLVAELGPVLDYQSGRPGALAEVLGLGDEELIESLGGRRREVLRQWHAGGEARSMDGPCGGTQLCRHDGGYPAALSAAWAPAVLSVLGGRDRLAALAGRPAVAFLDSPEASDYGRAMARSMARALTAAGLTVAAGVTGPVGRAAHAGAAQAGGSLAVLGQGLVSRRGRTDTFLSLVLRAGCVISELPWDCGGRKWGPVAAERIVAGLGAATVVVESRGEERDLWAARLGGPVGAVPGMVTNPLAGGPHRLLADGARLLAGPGDVLELLYEAGASCLPSAPMTAGPTVGRRLQAVLDLVGAGADTPELLAAAARQGRLEGWTDAVTTFEVMAALGRLEANGSVSRTEQGRYVRRDPAPCAFAPGADMSAQLHS